MSCSNICKEETEGYSTLRRQITADIKNNSGHTHIENDPFGLMKCHSYLRHPSTCRAGSKKEQGKNHCRSSTIPQCAQQ